MFVLTAKLSVSRDLRRALVWDRRACNFGCLFKQRKFWKSESLSSHIAGTSLYILFPRDTGTKKGWGGASLLGLRTWYWTHVFFPFYSFPHRYSIRSRGTAGGWFGLYPVPRPCCSLTVLVLFICWDLEWFSHAEVGWDPVYKRAPTLKLSHSLWVNKSHDILINGAQCYKECYFGHRNICKPGALRNHQKQWGSLSLCFLYPNGWSVSCDFWLLQRDLTLHYIGMRSQSSRKIQVFP